MSFKKWEIAEIDKQLAKDLSLECDIDPIVALIASSRGYTDPTELEEFLSDEPIFSDPKETADIILAADIVNSAIENGDKIAVFGDYDCDGVTATALLYSYLQSRNAVCTYYIPDRFTEGYGMNCDAIKKLAENDVRLIITVDNGIACIDEIAFANSLGIEVVVTDHHLPGETLPEAAAIVDPHRKDCPSSFKSVCGAQVAFRLICVMENKEPEELLSYFADILTVAVIADIMPLTGENRSIVKYGIEKLKTSPSIGLRAILSVAGIDLSSVDASRVAFGISPRINAAGRMGKASRAVELLCSDNIMSALALANEIDGDNSARQQIEKKIYEEAVGIIETEKLNFNRVIVVSGSDWHHGVVGIVAARITEKYGRPTVLLSSDGETAVGSGRSIEGFSLFDAISSVRELTEKFGGHELAAGVTLKDSNIREFRRRINEYALTVSPAIPKLKLDCKLKASALNLDLVDSLSILEPFGTENKVPLFGIFGVKLDRITPIGNNKHLRLIFTKDDNAFQALLFGVSSDNFCFQLEDILDLAVTVDKNYFKGEYSLSIQIKGIRMNGTDDDKLFSDIYNLSDFCSGGSADYKDILPTREEVGEVYKYILKGNILSDRVKYNFINSLGYAKCEIAVITLEELGLIRKDVNGYLCAERSAQKTNLINSPTYKLLCERSENGE